MTRHDTAVVLRHDTALSLRHDAALTLRTVRAVAPRLDLSQSLELHMTMPLRSNGLWFCYPRGGNFTIGTS